MATKDELSEQLSLTQKITAATEQMARAMSRVDNSYTTQVDAARQLADALKELKNTDIGSMNQVDLGNLQKELSKIQKETDSLTKKVALTSDAMGKKLPKSALLAAGALKALHSTLAGIQNISKGVLGFLMSAVKWLSRVATSIVSIPFKMLKGLEDAAASAELGMNELLLAIEGVRKEFGDLGGPSSKAVLDAAFELKGFADTGLSAFAVFGTMAQRIEYMTKVASAMGASFTKLNKEFEENGGALLAYQKGLGITDEQMKGIGDRAITMGKPMGKVLNDITKQTLGLGKAFGISQKVIGKEMSKAIADVKHFGQLSEKEIGKAVVYANKLGLSLDKVVGTLDAFETFDQSAENVAKLSQSFGVTLDAFKLMDAQNPAEQLDMLRKSFKNAGVDTANFTRQQLKLVSQTTGMDEATVKQALSLDNMGVSLKDVGKQADANAKKSMTQQEAMSKLADSIERMNVALAPHKSGLWKSFVDGFLGGIKTSKEFRDVIISMQMAFKEAWMAGRRLGAEFVKLFPGVKDMLEGIKKLFDPKRIREFFNGFVDDIKKFMQDMDAGRASFPELMERLKKRFFDFFDKSTPAGAQFLGGMKKFLKALSFIFSEAIKWIGEKIADGLRSIVALIANPNKLSGAGNALSGGLGFLTDLLKPIVKALAGAVKVIWPPLLNLLKQLAKKVWEFLSSDEAISFFAKYAPMLAGVLFGPSLTKAIITTLGASLVKGAGTALSAGIAKLAAGAGKLTEGANTMPDPKAVSNAMGAAGSANKAMGDMKSKDDWGVKDAVKLGLKLFALATALALAGPLLALSVLAMTKILKGVELHDLIKPMILLAGVMLGAAPLMLATKYIGQQGTSILKEILIGTAALGLMVALIGVAGLVVAALGRASIEAAGGAGNLEAIGNFMVSMAEVFLLCVPLIAAAAAIGIAIIASFGLGAAAAAAGLAAISAFVAKLAEQSTKTVEAIASLKIDSDFKIKIDAFVSIMKAIREFTEVICRIMEAMKPSLFGLIAGESFVKNIDSATKFIESLIGSDSPPKGIIGIISIVKDTIAQLGEGGPKMLQGAKILEATLSAISSVMKAATPPPELFQNTKSFLQSVFGGGETIVDKMNSAREYSEKMFMSIMNLLSGAEGGKGLVEMVRTLTTAADLIKDPKKVQAVASVLASVGAMVNAMMPNPETIKMFRNVTTITHMIGPDDKIEKIDAQGLNTVLNSSKIVMEETVPKIVDIITGRAIKFIGQVSDNDIPKVELLVKTLTAVSGIIGSLAQFRPKDVKLKSTSVKDFQEFVKDMIAQQHVGDDLGKLIDVLGNNFAPVIDKMITTVRDIKVGNPEEFKKNMEIASGMFGLLGQVPSLAKSLIDAADGAAKEGVDGEHISAKSVEEIIGKIKNTIGGVMEVFDFLFSDQKFNLIEGLNVTLSGTSFVARIAGLIKMGIKTAPKTLGEDVKTATDVIGQITSAISNIGNAIKTLSSADFPKDIATGVADRIIEVFTKGIVPIFVAVTSVLSNWFQPQAVNALRSAVSHVQPSFGLITTAMMIFNGFNKDLPIMLGGVNVDDVKNKASDIKKLFNYMFYRDGDGLVPILAEFMKDSAKDTTSLSSSLGVVAPKFDMIVKQGLGKTLNAIGKMVNLANDLGETLSRGMTFDADALLKRTSSAVGLGAKNNYTIRNKDVVINLNLKVLMNVDDVEKVMIMRKQSIIKDRIDYLTENSDVPDKEPLPDHFIRDYVMKAMQTSNQ